MASYLLFLEIISNPQGQHRIPVFSLFFSRRWTQALISFLYFHADGACSLPLHPSLALDSDLLGDHQRCDPARQKQGQRSRRRSGCTSPGTQGLVGSRRVGAGGDSMNRALGGGQGLAAVRPASSDQLRSASVSLGDSLLPGAGGTAAPLCTRVADWRGRCLAPLRLGLGSWHSADRRTRSTGGCRGGHGTARDRPERLCVAPSPALTGGH